MFQRLKREIFFLILFIVFAHQVKSQTGGGRSMEFLNLPGNARISALGGVNVSSLDKDINMFLSNPALLDASVHNNISLSHFLFLADVTLSTLTYGRNFDKAGNFGIGLQYLNYGTFEAYDATGFEDGTYTANEYALSLGNSHTVGSFTMGGTIKYAHSFIAGYNAGAVLFDLGGLYKHPSQDLTVGLAMKNLGFSLISYTDETTMNLPFDVQMGVSFKPEFMPIRLSVTTYNFYPSDVNYQIKGRAGNNKEAPGKVDKIMRHFAFGTEVLLNKNINLRVGYNHLIRQELRMEELSGGAGLSLGVLVRIKAFEIAYSKAFYHAAGGTDYFTLTSNLNSVFKNKKEFNEQK